MGINISLLGLDRLGISFGLALGQQDDLYTRRGYDPLPEKIRLARQMNAIDEPCGSLVACLQKAQVILLTLGSQDLHKTLTEMVNHLPEVAILLDATPVKAATFKWLQEMQPDLTYIALGLNPQSRFGDPLHENSMEPGASLFAGQPQAIACPPGTPATALDLASSLVRRIGGKPFYCDLAELYGWEATVDLLPLLLSTTLMNGSTSLPGWRDAGKLAGAAFANGTESLSGSDGSLPSGESLTMAANHVLPRLDSVIQELASLRKAIQDGNSDELEHLLRSAVSARQQWLKEQIGGEAAPLRMPDKNEFWRQQAGFLAGRIKPPTTKDEP